MEYGQEKDGDPICTMGTIAAGQMGSFTMTANANAEASGPVNVSVSSSVSDPDSGNNDVVETVAVVAQAGIPTVGTLGLILLALMILGGGVWLMRR